MLVSFLSPKCSWLSPGEVAGVAEGEATDPTLVLVDTAGCYMEELTTRDGISKRNPGEASVVVSHINSLVKAGVRVEDIAVVTPYNLQVPLSSLFDLVLIQR